MFGACSQPRSSGGRCLTLRPPLPCQEEACIETLLFVANAKFVLPDLRVALPLKNQNIKSCALSVPLLKEFRLLKKGMSDALKNAHGICDRVRTASVVPNCKHLDCNTVHLSGFLQPILASSSLQTPGSADEHPGPHRRRLFSIARDNAFRQPRIWAYPNPGKAVCLNGDYSLKVPQNPRDEG